MSLGSELSSHDRCVTYSASNLIMIIYYSLKREPKQSTTFLRFVFSHLLSAHDSLRLKKGKRTSVIAVADDKCSQTRQMALLC